MRKLFLLDAYALIYRAYYAFIKLPRINTKGLNTSAIYGFVNTLEEVLKKERPTHIGVAFDPGGPTFRHNIYKEYKAQREARPEDIRLAVPFIKEIIAAYNIPVLEVSGYEADDVIGTLATQAEARGDIETYMMTSDKDYAQLVATRIKMYRPSHTGGFEILGTEEVKEKYGVTECRQVIDLLGLMGDKSDNIPGCPGVGEKTAQKMIGQFGSIDTLLLHTAALRQAMRERVEKNAEQIRFSRLLATIKCDVPIELNMEQLAVKPIDMEALTKIYEELEFKNLLARMQKNAPKIVKTAAPSLDFPGLFADETTEAPEYSNLRDIKSTPVAYQLADNQEKRTEILAKFCAAKSFSLDTETTSTNYMQAELVGLSLCCEENSAYYVPIPSDRKEAEKIVAEFKPLLENEATMKVGQNIKFDMIMLRRYGAEVRGPLFDTMIAHYLLQPDLHHGMDYLAAAFLKYRTLKIEDLIGEKGKGQRTMRQLSPADVYLYACEEADVTFKLYRIFEQSLRENGLETLFREIEMPLIPVLAYMEWNGARLDTEALRQTSAHFTKRLISLEEQIYALAGERFNISSPRQVGYILYEKLKIADNVRKTKNSKQFSTSEEVLESLRHRHIIVGKILDYRGLKKLLSTYIDALPTLVNPDTGKIHTSYNQAVAATGRLSSSNPNLQNIPIRNEDGKEIRKAFIPDEGCTLFSADYSQIELRIMAHLSGDENMIAAFNSDSDIHAATAAKVLRRPLAAVTSEERNKAKTATFGIV